jgi:hypothetical protein
MCPINESTAEEASLAWFWEPGYEIEHGLNFSLEPQTESATSAPDQALEVKA